MRKKKNTDPIGAMQDLLRRAVELAVEPFLPERDPSLPSLRSVAEELKTTVIRARKLLITAGYFRSPLSDEVQRLKAEGKSIEQICEELYLGQAAVYGYLPYENLAYNLPETTCNADRHKRYRATKKLRSAVADGDWQDALRKCIIVFEDYTFHIMENGKKKNAFTYRLVLEDNRKQLMKLKTNLTEITFMQSFVELFFKQYFLSSEAYDNECIDNIVETDGSIYLFSIFIRFMFDKKKRQLYNS